VVVESGVGYRKRAVVVENGCLLLKTGGVVLKTGGGVEKNRWGDEIGWWWCWKRVLVGENGC